MRSDNELIDITLGKRQNTVQMGMEDFYDYSYTFSLNKEIY